MKLENLSCRTDTQTHTGSASDNPATLTFDRGPSSFLEYRAHIAYKQTHKVIHATDHLTTASATVGVTGGIV